MMFSRRAVTQFQKTVWGFSRKHRRDFPWRETRDPYKILVSEIMLQQTRVERVLVKYHEWTEQFPDFETLANAPLRNVLAAWQGLGYNRRALALRRVAQIVTREHKGALPRDEAKLRALPGVGPYTAGAVLAFAWDHSTPFVETNIRTVFLHHFFQRRRNVHDKDMLALVSYALPIAVSDRVAAYKQHTDKPEYVGVSKYFSVREWYYALMDYGAHLKKTVGNQNARSAAYARQSRFRGSKRELRGAMVRRAAQTGSVVLRDFTSERFSVADILHELVSEGFLKKRGKKFWIA